MGNIITTITLERKSKTGRLLEKRIFPSHSWTKHFFDLLYEDLAYNSNTLAGINDITSTARTLANQTAGLVNLAVASPPGGSIAPAFNGMLIDTNTGNSLIKIANSPLNGGENNGIVVGTGNTPVTPTDDKLVTKINHGTGAGLFEYGGCQVLAPVSVNPNGTMMIRRYFTNNSGGDITVQEAGIYSFGFNSASNVYSFCICRDVVSPGVLVANTQILSVVYTVQITV
jgi:hypothetical protein